MGAIETENDFGLKNNINDKWLYFSARVQPNFTPV